MKSTKILTHLGLSLGLLALMSGSAQAIVINQYTNEASWINNVGSYTIEDFEDNTLASPLQSITGGDVSISGGKLNDVINQGSLTPDTIFSFNPGVYGVGGTWNLAEPGGQGTSIIIGTSTGNYLLGLIPATTLDTFWGFTIDEVILDIFLVEGPNFNQAAVETYTLDNLLMATSQAGSTPVPEPATLALIGIGLIGVGFSRRKRNAKV